MRTLVRVPLERKSSPLGDYHLPKVRVRFSIPGRATSHIAFSGLVDTGSAYTLAPRVYASKLGITNEELAAAAVVTVTGLGGKSGIARRIILDLILGVAENDHWLELSRASVCFVDEPLPNHDILIGQYDALNRLQVVHRAQAPTPEIVLRHP